MGKGGYGMPGGMNMNNLMKQAQKMQQQMQNAAAELETKTYSGSAGGGVVEAVVSGKKELVKINIKPEAIDPDDAEMLEDLIVAAVNQALKECESDTQSTYGRITGGMGGLGGFGL